MKKILEAYFDLLHIPKIQKQIRHVKFQEWKNTHYEEMPNYSELKAFYKLCEDHKLTFESYFFFQKVQFPIYDEEIFKHKNLDALKYIYPMHENEFCNLKDDHDLDLLEVGLMLYPEDLELLHIKFKHEVRFLRLSIHEVPWIVMAGGATANIEETESLFKRLESIKELALKLGETIDETLIKECLYYWRHWLGFLKSDNKRYLGFEQYLNDHATSLSNKV